MTPFISKCRIPGKNFSGTGDLTASVIAGSMVGGLDAKEALEKSSPFPAPCLERASRDNVPGIHGISFEKYSDLLL